MLLITSINIASAAAGQLWCSGLPAQGLLTSGLLASGAALNRRGIERSPLLVNGAGRGRAARCTPRRATPAAAQLALRSTSCIV